MAGGKAAGRAAEGIIAKAVADLFRTVAKDAGKDVAKDAGRDVARDAARDAVRDAERDAAGQAERDAARQAERDAARPPDARHTLGDPVDVGTGEVVLSQVDVALAGVLPLVLSRTHLSSYRHGRCFGTTWASTVDQRLEFDAVGVRFLAEDGMVLRYPRPVPGQHRAGGTVLPVDGPRWPLADLGAGRFAVHDPGRGLTWWFAAAGGAAGGAFTELPVLAVTDRGGRRIEVRRDPAGMPVEVWHSGGYRVAVESADGLVTGLRLAGPGGGVPLLRFGYDADRRLVEVVNSSGLPLRFGYDPVGRLTSWQDRTGMAYRYRYDDAGRCVAAAGTGEYRATRLDYRADPRTGRVTTVTDSLGHTSSYEFTAAGQLARTVDPLGAATLSTWDRWDRMLSRTDPLGRTTSYRYDDAGNLVAVHRPDGTVSTADYNAAHLPTRITDPDGGSWLREYDPAGNLTAVVDPAGAVTRYRYDERGHLAGVLDPLGRQRQVRSDAAGLPLAVTDPAGATTSCARDAFGRVAGSTDALGNTTRYGWTVEGAPAWRVRPDGAADRWSYDGEGNLVAHVDPLGQLTRTEVGPFDLPVARTEPDGSRTEYRYDTELRLVAASAGPDLEWTYEYDPAGRLVAETDLNRRTVRYGYDPAGQLVSRTTASGQATRYVRDPAGRVVERHSADGAVSRYERDGAGRVLRASGPDAEVALTRDRRGRVVAETVNGRTVEAGYDPLGRQLHRRTPAGTVSVWEYGAADQPLALHTAGHTIRFGYDPVGREVARQLGPATVLEQGWDANSQLRYQAVRTGPAGQSRLLHRHGYTYRPDGRPTAVDDLLTGPRQYELDPVGRVTGVTAAGWTERYRYDAAGTVSHAEYPAAGPPGTAPAPGSGERAGGGSLVRTAGRVRYEHDPDGRLVRRTQRTLSGGTLGWQYRWNADDQLAELRTPDGVRWRYSYDPFGRRIGKQRLAADGGVAEQTDFSWDGTVLVEESSRAEPSAGQRTTSWDYLPGTYRPIAQAEPTQPDVDRRFYAIVTDLVGTPTELVSPAGEVAWQHRVTVWGNPLGGHGAGTDCPLRFPGQYQDPETGFHYNYQRHYDPGLGGYASPDPLGLFAGINPHLYVRNPLDCLDPLGLMTCPAGTDPVAVIGRLPDTAEAKGWPGHDVLDIPDWTITKNDRWVQDVIDRKGSVYVASNPTFHNMWDAAAGRPTVFSRELGQFTKAGYTWDGWHLHPPGPP